MEGFDSKVIDEEFGLRKKVILQQLLYQLVIIVKTQILTKLPKSRLSKKIL